MKVKLKKLHEDAKLPVKSKEGDFCYDVWAVDEEEVAPNVWKYRLGFSYEIERDYLYALSINLRNLQKDINISIDARPRSSVWSVSRA